MFAVESKNVVGYQNTGVTKGDRKMCTPATFINVGGTLAGGKLGDIKQVGGYPSVYTLATYGNNVNLLKEYWYFDAAIAEEMTIEEGWYELNADGDDALFDLGAQNNLPLATGTGVVIVSVDEEGEAAYSSAGEVYPDVIEFGITKGDRKMTGNVLPKSLKLGDIKQVGGYPSVYTLATYGNNVNLQNEYWYFDAAIAEEMTIEEGWYKLNEDGDDALFDLGAQNFDVPSGTGFVVVSVDEEGEAVLRFPKAM